MGPGPDTRRSHIDLARIDFGIGDEFGERFCGNGWMHSHDIGKANDSGDRHDVAEKYKTELVIKRRVEGSRRVDEQERAALWLRAYTRFLPNRATATGSVSTTNCWPSRSESHGPMSR